MKRFRSGWILVITAILTSTSLVAAQRTRNSWRAAAALPKGKTTQNVMVNIQRSSNEALSFNYRVPDIVLNEVTDKLTKSKMTRLNLGNTPIRGNEGEPVLPVVPVQFVIPYGHEIASLHVTGEKKRIMNVSSAIEFGSAPVPLKRKGRVRNAVPKMAIYAGTKGFPEKNNELVSIQNKRGVKIGIVNVHPVIYFPSENKIEYCKEFTIDITFKEHRRFERYSRRFRAIPSELKKIGVENPEVIQTYKEGNRADSTLPKILIGSAKLDAAESFQYVVITNEAMRDAATDVTITDLVAYRQSAGVTARLVTVEDILSEYDGVDDPEKIRNFIIDAYTNWETEYVVLGGDVNIIPVRDLYTPEDILIHSDFYYQCLDGTFNGDGDGYWGEPNDGEDGGDVDLFAEVNIGRISAETPEEMANAVYKILTYEKLDEADDCLRRCCMVGEELGSDFGIGEFSFARPYMNEIKNGSTAAGYTTVGFKANPSFLVDSLYDFDREWPVDSIMARINSNRYSIFNHLGHADVDQVMKMYMEDVDHLTNTKPFFVFSQGCYPGDMTTDCIAEHLTTSNRNGLFAGVFNSNFGWGDYNEDFENFDAPSQRINRQFWDAYFSEYIDNVGAINADSHEDNVWDINADLIRFCIYETNLFGDPFTVIRGQIHGPSISLKSSAVDDRSSGNGDHIVNPGEEVQFSISLQNLGNKIAESVSVQLSTLDQYITISEGTLSFGDIACCGSVATSDEKAMILIASDCPTPYSFPITVEITDNAGNNWVNTTTLTVHTTYTISGRVVTLTGANPITGARVKVKGPVCGEVTTDTSGNYMFMGIEGVYSICAEATDYLTSSIDTVIMPPSVKDFDIMLGRPQIVVDPVAIQHELKMGDSIVIPLMITNSGDKDLLVIPTCRTVSAALGTGQPRLIRGSGVKDGKERCQTAVRESTRKMVPSDKWLRKATFSRSKIRALYLTTMFLVDETDSFLDGIRNLPNVAFVDVVNGEDSTPNLDLLLQYDVVIVSSDYGWADAELTGTTLADYCDAGGNVCLMVGTMIDSGNYGLKGRIITKEYLPMKMGGQGDHSSAVTFESHQITKSMTSLETSMLAKVTELQGISGSLGTYNNGYLIGAYAKNRPLVAINVFPRDGDWGGDLVLMMGNTFDWFIQGKWLSISPANKSLVIPPGTVTEVSVMLKSVNMFGGIYSGEIMMSHNNPQETSPFVVPVSLIVDGFKSLSVTPSTVDFDSLWFGLKDTFELNIKNDGTQKTIINAFEADNKIYTVTGSLPLSVMAGESVNAGLVYAPRSLGTSATIITILSDAEDNPSIRISAKGVCTLGPKGRLEPPTMTFNLTPGDVSKKLTAILTNIGGDILSYSTIISQERGLLLGAGMEKMHLEGSDVIPALDENVRSERELNMARAFESAAPQWLTINPDSSGTLDVEGRQTFTVVAYSKGLVAGEWEAEIGFHTNDPVSPDHTITVLMNISAFRSLQSGSDTIVFSTVWAGCDTTVSLELINTGNAPVTISSFNINSTAISCREGVPFTVGPFGRYEMPIVFAPEESGVYKADVEIFSNAEDNPELTVHLQGEAITPPIITVNPLSIKRTLPHRTIENIPITLTNDGGAEYQFKINNIRSPRGDDSVTQGGSLLVGTTLFLGLRGDTIRQLDVATGEFVGIPIKKPVRSSPAEDLAYDGNYLYFTIMSNEIAVINPLDGNVVRTISCKIDDAKIDGLAVTDKYIILGDYAYEKIYICDKSNGNVVTAWGCPYYCGCVAYSNTRQSVFVYNSYDFLIEERSIHDGELYGKIYFDKEVYDIDYSENAGALIVATQSDGITVLDPENGGVIVSYPISDVWSIATHETGGYGWLQTDIKEGSVSPGKTITFNVVFNSSKMYPGIHTASLKIQQQRSIPSGPHEVACTLTVLEDKQCRVSPPSLNFNNTWVGETDTFPIYLVNLGNTETTVTSVVSNNPLFDALRPTPFIIEPFDSVMIPVTFTPNKAIQSTGTLVIKSDVSVDSEVNVTLTGKSLDPPRIRFIPEIISRSLFPGKTLQAIVKLQNTGGADFRFMASIEHDQDLTEVSWLQPSIKGGVIPANCSFNLPITFNSKGMMPGMYQVKLKVEHYNGMSPGPYFIPCELMVLPLSRLTISPKIVDFGNVLTGKDSSVEMKFKNTGNKKVSVKSILSFSRDFSIDISEKDISPFGELSVKARFAPSKVGTMKTTVVVISNAIELPIRTFSLTGSGVCPPKVVTDPNEFRVQLRPNGRIQDTLTLVNSGGVAYDFNIVKYKESKADGNGSNTLYVMNNGYVLSLDNKTFEPNGDSIAVDPDSYMGGLAFDGEYFYIPGSPFASFLTIQKINPNTPGIVDTIVVKVNDGWISGLGVIPEYLLILDSDNQRVYLVDKENGAIIRSFIVIGGYGALTAATARNSFYLFNEKKSTIDEMGLQDGSLINRFPVPAVCQFLSGAGYSNDDSILFLSDYNGVIVAVDPDDGTLLASVKTQYFEIGGLAADEASEGCSWIELSINSGVVPPGEMIKVPINFNAKNMVAGDYYGGVTIVPRVSDAPGPFTIPCMVSVRESETASRE